MSATSEAFGEKFCKAVEVIFDKKIKKIKRDNTIVGVIESAKPNENGNYRVKVKNSGYWATPILPWLEFNKGDSVLMLVPQENFSEKKLILSHANKGKQNVMSKLKGKLQILGEDNKIVCGVDPNNQKTAKISIKGDGKITLKKGGSITASDKGSLVIEKDGFLKISSGTSSFEEGGLYFNGQKIQLERITINGREIQVLGISNNRNA